MTDTTDKRRCDRISIRLEVYFSEDLHEVVGTLTDISYSGALIEDTSMQPAIGTPCALYLHLEPSGDFNAVSSIKLTGRVVRHISTGFAIEYNHHFDLDIRQLVDDAAAILTASG